MRLGFLTIVAVVARLRLPMPATGLFLRDGTRVRNPADMSREADSKDQGILELWAGTAIIYGTPANV